MWIIIHFDPMITFIQYINIVECNIYCDDTTM